MDPATIAVVVALFLGSNYVTYSETKSAIVKRCTTVLKKKCPAKKPVPCTEEQSNFVDGDYDFTDETPYDDFEVKKGKKK